MRRLRAAALSEVELAMDIINQAKAHLRAQGIDQWQTGYPDRDCLGTGRPNGKRVFSGGGRHPSTIGPLSGDFALLHQTETDFTTHIL